MSFQKGYYPRVNGEKFGGRVTRLFVSPLINALKKYVGVAIIYHILKVLDIH